MAKKNEMKLHEVIKKIADEHGIGVVCQEYLVNFVSDLATFDR